MKKLSILFISLVITASVLCGAGLPLKNWLFMLPGGKLYVNGTQYIGYNTSTYAVDCSTGMNVKSLKINSVSVDGIFASTGTLATNLAIEVTSRTVADTALGQSTATLQTNIGNEAVSRANGDSALGTSTATLQSNIDVTSAGIAVLVSSTAINNGDIVNLYSTGTANNTEIANLKVATGTLDTAKFDKSGGTITGNTDADKYSMKMATATITSVLELRNLSADPLDAVLSTGTVWMRGFELYISTGMGDVASPSAINKAKFLLTTP